MTIVIGIDPGGTTGLAVVEYTWETGYRLVAHIGAPLATPIEVVNQIRAMTRELAPAAWWIAAERFVVNRRASRSSSAKAGERARSIIGGVEAVFPLRVKLRNASAAKGWATDDRIHAAGLWPAQGRPHTTDAVRHALYMLVTTFGHPDPIGGALVKRPETS